MENPMAFLFGLTKCVYMDGYGFPRILRVKCDRIVTNPDP